MTPDDLQADYAALKAENIRLKKQLLKCRLRRDRARRQRDQAHEAFVQLENMGISVNAFVRFIRSIFKSRTGTDND